MEKTESIEIRYVKSSPLDLLNPATTELINIVRTLEANIAETKAVTKNLGVNNPMPHAKIAKEDALKRAMKNGFNATWTEVALQGNVWVITGRSKSASPPSRTVVSAFDGTILKTSLNTDADATLSEFTLTPASESYRVENIETKPTWKK